MDRVYITLCGKSPYAFINSYYASLEYHGFKPDKIHLMYDRLFEPQVKGLIESIQFINNEYGIEATIYTDNVNLNSVTASLRTFLDIVDEYDDSDIALDSTSGRKYMVTALMLKAWDMCDHIFFLQTDDLDEGEMPFMLRPIYTQHPIDLKEEVHSL